jgi:hypothetical protein
MPRTHAGWTAFSAAVAAALLMPASVQAAQLDGVWRSRGYGVVVELSAGDAALYHITGTSCLRNTLQPWTRLAFPAAKRGLRKFDLVGPWGLTVLHFERVAALPARCRTPDPEPRDALHNFDVFWQTFEENYAFFVQRGIDWPGIRARYRPMLARGSTDEELLAVLATILRQLQDRHVTLNARGTHVRAGLPALVAGWYADDERGARSSGRAAGEALLRDKLVEYLSASWATHLDPGSVRRISSNVVVGSAAEGRFGYLSIAAESGYAPAGGIDEDRIAAIAELTDAVVGVAGKAGLIVDLRFNFGGSDEVGLAVAGLLTARNRPGFSKCAREGAGSTPVQRTRIEASRQAFTGPTVVLTSQLTASAAENIAMMVKDFPNVLLVGERTAGVHSDPLLKSLPNGWTFTLSNERFVAPDGRSYEAMGVPPGVLMPFDPESVRATGVDPQLEKALQLLDSGRLADLASKARHSPGSGRPSDCR